MNARAPTWQPVAGFEASAYAWCNGALVWAGAVAHTDHPRNAHRPWQPPPLRCDAARLKAGARTCLGLLQALPPKGLLAWLLGHELPFPLKLATPRFDAVRNALRAHDLPALEAAACRVLGLGPGLTPSGDDFIGGAFFALAHAPPNAWCEPLAAVRQRLLAAAQTATNEISAHLLADMLNGTSYRALHEVLGALQGNEPAAIEQGTQALLGLGASSGADMLAGLLLALLNGTVNPP